MPRSALTFACLLLLLPLAACGRSGSRVAASLSGMFPASVFTSRTYEIGISGLQTGWDASSPPAIDLGPGITLTDVTVASATALILDIEVEDDAPTGPRDVTIGGLTFAGFDVRAPMALELESGRFEQGARAFGTLVCLDPETPFDDSDDFIVVEGPPGLFGLAVSAGPGALDVDFSIDPSTPAGPFALTLSGSAEPLLRVQFVAPNAGSVLARAPLTAFPADVAITGPESGLQRYDAGPVAALVQFPFVNTGITPVVPQLVPTLGWEFVVDRHANDMTTGPMTITVPGGTAWIYGATSDGSSAAYTLGVPVVTTAPTVNEVEPNGTLATAQPIVPPVIVLEASFANLGNNAADYYAIAVAPADVGKVLHVTSSGNDFSAVLAIVYRADGTTSLGSSSVPGGHVDFVSSPIPAAETIYIRLLPQLSIDSSFIDFTPYRLMVRLE